MKKLYILAFVLLVATFANAQGCLPDSIVFGTQSQIDSFQISYPGCTRIEGNVVINSNWNNPITNLNGLSVLTSIGGTLFIGSVTMSDLTGLNNLTAIGGTLQIASYSLISLTGLEKVTSIGGNLIIRGGPFGWGSASRLTSLMGLQQLTSVGGDLTILGIDSLPGLTGLENLKTIGGGLQIHGNSALTSLSGLDNINAASITSISIYGNTSLADCHAENICDYLVNPHGTVEIYSNAPGCNSPWEIASGCGITMPCLPYGNYYFFSQADIDNFHTYSECSELKGNVIISGQDIVNLNGLNEVTSIVGDLNIGLYNLHYGWNPRLKNLTGLENLTYIDGTLTISNNDSLVTLSGLDNLTSVGGDVLIGINYIGTTRSNYALSSLAGLRNLKTVRGDVYIASSALTSLSGLDSLILVGGRLTIYDNMSLISLSGLGNLTSIGGGLEIFYNSVTSLSGLVNVSSIGGGVDINENKALKSLEGLEKLTSIGDGTYGLQIEYNDSLASLKGLDNLQSINGSLLIEINPQLSSVVDLGELTTVWGDLSFNQNPALTSLTGLENLRTIGGDLGIERNGLTSIAGLDNLTAASINNLTIISNFSLSTCSVQSICDYLASPNGEVRIGYNATGCFGVWEVEAGCDTLSAGDLKSSDPLSIYPNPTTGIITIEANHKACFTILNLNGQELLKQTITEPKTQIDIGNLPCGIYIVRIMDEKTVHVGKIVKE